MANTFTLTRTGNVVKVEEFDSNPTLVNVSILSTEHNVFKHNTKPLVVVISKNSNFAGNGKDTEEYPIASITGNPTPTDVLATVAWLATTYFIGIESTSVAVGAISVSTDDLERDVWDKVPGQVKTIVYYTGVVAGNPSGSLDNVHQILYTGSTEPARPDFTQTFTWDASDRPLTITAS